MFSFIFMLYFIINFGFQNVLFYQNEIEKFAVKIVKTGYFNILQIDTVTSLVIPS